MNSYYANLIARLRAGEEVVHRGKGNSMVPLIYSGQSVRLKYVEPELIRKGDIVLCKVRGSVFDHLVTGIRGNEETLEFQISNNHGHVNGWTRAKNIFGKVIEVLPR
jgi:hypothetical protein